MTGLEQFGDKLEKLGKYKTGKSCLYINKLEDVDLSVLKQLVEANFKKMAERYPEE